MAEAKIVVNDTSTSESCFWTNSLVIIYTLSGMTSLAFEVLWARMLSMQFGVSIFGVVITIAAFMAGLGLGSLLGERWSRRLHRPLLVFAMLEAGVALYALGLPWAFETLDALLLKIAAGSNLDVWYLYQSIALLGVMLIPATAMGIGFPLVLRAISGRSLSLGKIYGVNACGAAVGALLPLYLLPAFGWTVAVKLVAGLGFIVSIAAALLASLQSRANWQAKSKPRLIEKNYISITSFLSYGGIGAAAIILEVGWTRLFGMILLRTEYVMAIILAVFLVGIGIGSLISGYLRQSLWLNIFPVLVAIGSIASLWAVPLVSQWAEQATFSSLASALWWQGGVLAMLTLPVTIILGAWLPILTRYLGNQMSHGAWLYGINSLGAAIGGLTAGFILIPWLGTTVTIITASIGLFIFGMTWASTRKQWIGIVIPLLLAWPVITFPPVERLLPQANAASTDLYLYEDAMSITQVVERTDGQRVLLSDLQRMDAASDPTAVALQKNQARLALLLHPDPKSVLFLGLGTGISAAGSLPFPDLERTAVELSRGSIKATEYWFAPVNDDVSQRLNIIQDDARRFLRTSDQYYDVIIGDVFHPDLVGRSALLSVQQFKRTRARLSPGGIFVQWLALNQFDVEALQVVLRSFYQVFPEATLFMDGFRLALVGPRNKMYSVSTLLSRYNELSEIDQSAVTGKEGIWTWLGRYWGRPSLNPGVVQDEWRPQIEFSLPHIRFNGSQNLVQILSWLLGSRPRVELTASQLDIPEKMYAPFKRAYVATDFATRSWLAGLKGEQREADKLMRFAYEANPQDRWVGFALADAMLATISEAMSHGLKRRDALAAVLRVRPDHIEALRQAWKLELASGDRDAAGDYYGRMKVLSPLDRDVRRDNDQSIQKSQ